MKSKKNQANVLAKECMVSALMQLLEDKPLSAISVTELTEKAGVSRMTYYRNYQSKEEIFQDYLDDIVDSYRSDVASWPSRGNSVSYTHLDVYKRQLMPRHGINPFKSQGFLYQECRFPGYAAVILSLIHI